MICVKQGNKLHAIKLSSVQNEGLILISIHSYFQIAL